MNTKEELEKIIWNWKEECFSIWSAGEVSNLAQTIIDRLEIDKNEIIETLSNKLTATQCEIIADGIKQFGHIGIYGRSFIANIIAKAKPIKIKED